MITPRTTRLLRVPDLRAMHDVVAAIRFADAQSARACAVLVPARGAAEELRRTVENRLLLARGSTTPGALILPDFITRDEFYVGLHARLPGAPPLLSDFEREVLLRRAARAASAEAPAPFRLRAGLIVKMLAFYDELRRNDRTIEQFDRLITGTLASSIDIDRGAERMFRQTRFLAAAFREFERRIDACGAIDEHRLRDRLIAATSFTYTHVIVTMPDQGADTRGLWVADYDLLARVPGLERFDVIATENFRAAGFHERIHNVLPGIIEERAGASGSRPALIVPKHEPGGDPVRWFTSRDREDELAEAIRAFKQRDSSDSVPLDRSAIVFQRPLPYLYLARHVFDDGGVPYQAFDALPLAAEPFAAALDLLFSFVTSEGTRATLVELLASPHWSFTDPATQRPIARNEVAAADAVLRELKYVGGWDRLATIAVEPPDTSTSRRGGTSRERASPALRAAQCTGAVLTQIADGRPASSQIQVLLEFIREHERLPQPADPWYERHLRARAAVLGALEGLRDAHARHDDEALAIEELMAAIRRWIEGQTFAARAGTTGVTLMDAEAAAFADMDEIRLVGLVESDWPERSSRSIFYPASLLAQLGWPSDADRIAAARARFHDLLALPARRLILSTFTLEDDAVVSPSPLLDELEDSGLVIERQPASRAARLFVHEAIAGEPVVADAVHGPAAEWLAVRTSRSAHGEGMFHGLAGARDAATYAVSHLERYLECPFKYFAGYVLRLDEERDEESGLTPQERGQFLHAVFERFFVEWHASGRRAITTANIGEALSLFERVAETNLQELRESDRALERNYLLGSAVAAGLAGRAFGFEIEQGVEVIERLLEHALEGEFSFRGAAGERRLKLRAKADRIDLLADGTLRVIDYKLGRAPKPSRALQLPVYGICAQQYLAGRHGRTWTLSRAGYLAFREKTSFVPLGASSSVEEALASGQERLLAAVDGIEAGTFPPQPDDPFLCTRCGFAAVCRKDYIGDE